MEELGVDGRIILHMFLKNKMGDLGLDSSGSGWRQVVGSCEYCNGASGTINCRGISSLAKILLAPQEELCSMVFS